MQSLDSDPRWRRLQHGAWTCLACGEAHRGLPDLACEAPDFWPGSEEKDPNSVALSSSHFLSEDFCVVRGQHFFLRCVLELPILGSGGQSLGFGVWATLWETSYRRYLETFDSGEHGQLGPWSGRLCNRLEGYPDTRNMKCRLHPRDGRQRPRIALEAPEHPLTREQREGITLDRVLELHALNGHDFARSLVD
jgi:hypothetical protein